MQNTNHQNSSWAGLHAMCLQMLLHRPGFSTDPEMWTNFMQNLLVSKKCGKNQSVVKYQATEVSKTEFQFMFAVYVNTPIEKGILA